MALTRHRMENLWLAAMFTALLGYAWFDRGFGQFFVGELLLVLGTILFLVSRRVLFLFKDPVLLLWLLFAVFGAVRTVPYLKTYRLDAVRDAVLWGYGLSAVLFAAFLNETRQLSHLLYRYSKFVKWGLVFFPLLAISAVLLGGVVPQIPWSAGGARLLDIKSGDAGVQLAGMACFVLLFREPRDQRRSGTTMFEFFGAISWIVGLVYVMVRSRAGLLAIVVPIVIISLLRAKTVGLRLAVYVLLLAVGGGLVLESNLITIGSSSRALNADVVNKNLASILGSSASTTEQEGTKKFRTVWWGHIWDYTVNGPYFWGGRGFGINLAVLEGHGASDPEEAHLRSPHSGTMSVLARMGVPGFTLWVLLTLTFVYRMYRSYRNARYRGSRFWTSVQLWIFCFWLSAFINMSFDVYLEGPQGGIWYWSLMGLGVAAGRLQDQDFRRDRIARKSQVIEETQRARVFAHVT